MAGDTDHKIEIEEVEEVSTVTVLNRVFTSDFVDLTEPENSATYYKQLFRDFYLEAN